MKALSFLQLARRHSLSVFSGAVAGGLLAVACLKWGVNLAPYYNETSSAWAPAKLWPAGTRSAAEIYRPRIDELLQGVRVNGRAGGLAWQNLRETVEAWLLTDPVACLNHLNASGALGLVSDFLLDVAIEREAGGNFAVALRMADEIHSGAIRSRWITRAFEQFVSADPESAFLAVDSVPTHLQSNLRFIVAQRWAAKDPQKAFDMFLRMNRSYAQVVAFSWADNNPEAAFAFFANAPRTMRKDSGQAISSRAMLGYVMTRIVGHAPEKMIQLLGGFPANGDRARNLRSAFSSLGVLDPRRALDLASGLAGDLERLEAKAEIAAAAIQHNPALAAEIRASLPGERSRTQAEASSVWERSILTYEKPAAAAQKVSGITDPIARADATYSVSSVWLQKKPQEFAKFAAEEVKTGNVTWIRAMADVLVDWADRNTVGPPPMAKLKADLGEAALKQLRKEISLQANVRARERLQAILAEN